MRDPVGNYGELYEARMKRVRARKKEEEEISSCRDAPKNIIARALLWIRDTWSKPTWNMADGHS